MCQLDLYTRKIEVKVGVRIFVGCDSNTGEYGNSLPGNGGRFVVCAEVKDLYKSETSSVMIWTVKIHAVPWLFFSADSHERSVRAQC